MTKFNELDMDELPVISALLGEVPSILSWSSTRLRSAARWRRRSCEKSFAAAPRGSRRTAAGRIRLSLKSFAIGDLW